MTVKPKYSAKHTVEDFDAFIELPENEGHIFELIDGEIVEKVPNNALASEIALWIGFLILSFLEANDIEGHVTGEAGGYKISGSRYAPDVAYLPASKQEKLESKGYNSIPPDLAVEVETNTTNITERRLRKKITTYLNMGIVVWVVYPETFEIEIHAPDKEVVTLGIDDTLDAGDVLPGFSVSVKRVFKLK